MQRPRLRQTEDHRHRRIPFDARRDLVCLEIAQYVTGGAQNDRRLADPDDLGSQGA